MIRVLQCLCSKQHCIMGIAYDPRTLPSETAFLGFRTLIEEGIATQRFNPWCALCFCPAKEWHYTDINTKFSTIEQARPVVELFEVLEQAQKASAGQATRN
jgi:hypothetical protein